MFTQDSPHTSDQTLAITIRELDREESINHEISSFRTFLTHALSIYAAAAESYSKLMRQLEQPEARLQVVPPQTHSGKLDVPLVYRVVNLLLEGIETSPEAMLFATRAHAFQYILAHPVNVAIISTLLARAMGYSADDVKAVCVAGFLHDIGKMQYPMKVINNPRKLSTHEAQMLRKHSEFSLHVIVEYANIPLITKRAVIEHHERFDGSGYPRKLFGDGISDAGYIVGMADMFDAMLTERPYQHRSTPQQVVSVLYNLSDKNFPAHIVMNFVECFGVYPLGSMVKLNTGYCGVVVAADANFPLQPCVAVIKDEKNKIIPPNFIDLSISTEWKIVKSIPFDLDTAALGKLIISFSSHPGDLSDEIDEMED